MPKPTQDKPATVATLTLAPFAFDGDKITLAPEVYTLCQPVTFKRDESTSGEGIEYTGLPEPETECLPS